MCLLLLLATILLWTLLPRIPQDQSYHAFADARAVFGLANAANILSNAGFLVVGAAGIALLASPRRLKVTPAAQASLWCAMIGLVGTAAGSAWYHHHPNDATLFWDRLPMTLVFAGVVATALSQRVGQNVARVALALLFELGAASIIYWYVSGDLSLYVTMQFGGVIALVILMFATRTGNDPFPWWWVIGWYALAKLFELGDHAIWRMTGELVAGHALKHIAAAIASAGLLRPLLAR